MAERAAKSLRAGAVGKGAVKGKKGGKIGGAEEEREDSWQAVVLADSFETRFNPFTLEKPRCLLPLANMPLIEYTLEFLAMSGVSEIYIYCGAHTADLEQYLTTSKWHPDRSNVSPFSTLEILKSAATSVGDAMRDIDSRGLITGDFLLVHGDLVSNLPIDAALSAHRARRIADKNAIMTIVLRNGGLGMHRTKSHGVTPVFVIDPSSDRCLHYEEITPLQAYKYVNIDPELLVEHDEMEIRTDLIDCGIDICTPDVLALWSESFDYDVPRRHFLHGVLKDFELNGKTIHTEIITDHYAARVSNLQAYDAVSKDVLGRWTYPLVPDSNLVHGQSYTFSRGGICKEDGVILARTSQIGKRTVLGKETSIGTGTSISDSIIGRRCFIGKNVSISNSYIWDDVVIGDDSTVTHALIASEVVIGPSCTISPGALLSFGVRISPNTIIAAGSRLTCVKRENADVEVESMARVSVDTNVVGSSGDGYAFEDSDSEPDDGATLQSGLIYSTAHLNLSSESISTFSSEVSAASPSGIRSRLSSFAGSISDAEDGSGGSGGSGENFHKDAVADVLRTLSERGDFHNTRVEFTSLRLSNNATDHQVRRAIAVAFSKRIAGLIESGLEATKAVSATLSADGAASFVGDVAVGKDRKVEDQVDFMVSLQRDLATRKEGAMVLFTMCKELYAREIVEEDGFEVWWGDERGSAEGGMREVRGKSEAFMEWLREAEEESDEDDEESD